MTYIFHYRFDCIQVRLIVLQNQPFSSFSGLRFIHVFVIKTKTKNTIWRHAYYCMKDCEIYLTQVALSCLPASWAVRRERAAVPESEV